MSIEGNLDDFGPAPLQGWAADRRHPTRRLEVAVRLDGTVVHEGLADRYREDLEAAGIGDGRHGFAFDLREAIRAEQEQALELLARAPDESVEVIWAGTTAAIRQRAERLNGLRREPQWAINGIRLEGTELSVEGYVVPSARNPHLEPSLVLAGRPFDEFEWPAESPEIVQRSWFVPASGRLGFRARTRVLTKDWEVGRAAPQGHLVIDCRDAAGDPVLRHGQFYVPRDLAQQLDRVPEGSRMMRVQGSALADVHLLWGFSFVQRIDRLLREQIGRSLGEFRSILDWGCGCGRITRHLGRIEGPRVVGADIDADNVAWCREHLDGADFHRLALDPPSGLASADFDLVVGHSVMTHLREHDQFSWLEELRRLCAPDAVVLLTINGPTSLWWSQAADEVLGEWAQTGISDRVVDPALEGHISDSSYYRATFHRTEYVRERWAQFFRIEQVLPAFSQIQDLVLMRPTGC